MDIKVVWAAIQPLLAQLLQSPQFKSVVEKIWSDLIAKIVAGVHPDVATQQAQGQVAAAALWHLTGNPVADFQAFVSGLKPPVGGPTPPPAGTYTS